VPEIENQTPLMQQYWGLKNQVPDCLLFFRMGDFYELFGDDAVEASKILEITLTSRDKNKANPTPMAGVPHHSVQGYIQRLLKAGKKVAIGEQLEPPTPGKAIVKRDITRIFTPGVHFDVEGASSNFLAAIYESSLACLDVSTGEVLVGQVNADQLEAEFDRLPISHLIHLEKTAIEIAARNNLLIEKIPFNSISVPQATDLLKQQYGLSDLQTFLPESSQIIALGILVQYVLKTQQLKKLPHLRLPEPLQRPMTLELGPHTARHLDLDDLYTLINKTKTAMGARELKRRLHSPLRNPAQIETIQKSIKALMPAVSKLSPILSEVYDIERIMGRVTSGLANPRDILALGRSLSTLPGLEHLLAPFKILDLSKHSAKLLPLAQKITDELKDDAPLTSKDGGVFKMGTHPDLDRLITLNENGQQWLVDLETKERAATGIPSLKVRYNRVFGYYIEITQTHLKNVPSHYQRKQTMVGAERFFTEELKKFEDEIVHASHKQKALETELFEKLIELIRSQTSPIMETAQTLAELDFLTSTAVFSQQPGWIFPIVDGSLDIEIKAGRHPLVEASGGFVPNDLDLSPNSKLTLLITGPNMGGKSTVMRQVALIVILGQMGCAIPATAARWGVVSSLFTRIGAHDAIARGQSTFMVEMTELAYILHRADERSLIVLDEIGRGTSTYDGISVAWATLEWICNQIKARTLFATHYHELTHLTTSLPLLANAHMSVARDEKNKLRFLYLLKDGPTNESFGIHVAKIAGLPSPVIQRAWKILEQLESKSPESEMDLERWAGQMSLFTKKEETEEPKPDPLREELEKTDITNMTPVQALNFVVRLQEISRESDAKSS
jgi:DNA mismatch repair protein MutS